MSDPVGLETPAAGEEMTLNQKIATWVQGKKGQKVGDGECWTLAENALKQAGAKTSYDFGKVTANADYIWGTEIKVADIKAGDILQFRDHKIKVVTKIKVRFDDDSGWDEEEEEEFSRGHHTAVVDGTPDADGVVATLEQNIKPDGKVVQAKSLHTRSVAAKSTKEVKSVYDEDAKKKRNATVTTEVTITVTGTIWAYRPQKAEEEKTE